MTLHDIYPSVAYLRDRAQRRIPFFAWEYLDSGTGQDIAFDGNETALQRIRMWPRIAAGQITPKIETTLFGEHYSAPFGIAPVGLTGLMWPGAERHMAKAAGAARVPFCLSTVATLNPEVVYRIVNGMGWFQLYPPRDPDIRQDLIDRAKGNGFKVLVVTADVPTGSRRERQRRAGLSMPPRRDLRTLIGAAKCPAWCREILRHGQPRLRIISPYLGTRSIADLGAFINREFNGHLDWELLREIRDQWVGPIVLKGVMRPEDAVRAVEIGFDGIGVSNHGGRQFDGAPSAIEALPPIRDAIGDKARIIFDSGLRGGLDIARALALGADFCLLGRPFMYALGALGKAGPSHLIELLSDDLCNNMIQMGISDLAELPGCLVADPSTDVR